MQYKYFYDKIIIMINRQKKYLREIIVNYFGVTYNQLYEISEVSEKTLKSDLQAIQSALRKYNLNLCESKSKIYIPFEQKQAFIDAYEEIIKNDEKKMLPNEYDERKLFILNFLCESEGYISMNTLADELYVSKSTISAIIHELKVVIPELVDTASLTVSGRKGIKLNANEKEIRELLVRAFDKYGGIVTENRYFLKYLEEDLQLKLNDFLKVISNFLEENKIVIANGNISKLIVHTMIIVQRIRRGKFLDDNDVLNDSIFIQLSEKLKKIGIDINESELSSLPIYGLNRGIIKNKISINIVEEFINNINNKFNSRILRMEDAYPLIAHIDDFLENGIRNYGMKDFIFDEMLERLLSAYLLCGTLCELIYKYTKNIVDDENRVYMAMHIQQMYRKHLFINENILLYNPNVSECNMIKTDLKKHFGDKANIHSVYVRWDIEKKLEEIKFSVILSTESILANFNYVPFLKINSFLTNEDYNAINQIVYKNRPIKIIYGGSLIDNKFYFDNITIELTDEIVCIKNLYLICVLEPNLKLGIYGVNYKNSRIFIINNDLKYDFATYHRMINSFGRMIKENSI